MELVNRFLPIVGTGGSGAEAAGINESGGGGAW